MSSRSARYSRGLFISSQTGSCFNDSSTRPSFSAGRRRKNPSLPMPNERNDRRLFAWNPAMRGSVSPLREKACRPQKEPIPTADAPRASRRARKSYRLPNRRHPGIPRPCRQISLLWRLTKTAEMEGRIPLWERESIPVLPIEASGQPSHRNPKKTDGETEPEILRRQKADSKTTDKPSAFAQGNKDCPRKESMTHVSQSRTWITAIVMRCHQTHLFLF